MNQFIIIIFLFLFNCLANVQDKNLKNCKKEGEFFGAEDFSLDKESEILYISSHKRRDMKSIGELFFLDLKKENSGFQKIDTSLVKNFRPHGIHFQKLSGKKNLYVVSHPNLDEYNHSIEVFLIDKKITPIETMKSDFLVSPNDLFVLEDGKIFVSNDHNSNSKLIQLFADAFKMKTSKLSYFDGKKWSFLDSEMNLGNGVLVLEKNNKKFLYRASTTEEKIYEYELIFDKEKLNLKKGKIIELGTGPDNLEEYKGKILFAAHKSTFRFLWHASKEGRISPSEIIELNPETAELKTIYANKGNEISASATGIIHKNKLYISQVFDKSILVCEL